MKGSKLLRLDLPPAVWDALAEHAADAGVSVGVHCKRLLIAASGVLPPVKDVPEPAEDAAEPPASPVVAVQPAEIPTRAVMDRIIRWLVNTDRVKPDDITTKSGLLTWAVSQGFQP